MSPSFGPTFEVTGVPGRSLILFHRGNTHLDTRGCILLGSRFSVGFADSLALQESRIAFTAFMGALAGIDKFGLSIEDCWGGTTTMTTH
jgi:hypothetical protein